MHGEWRYLFPRALTAASRADRINFGASQGFRVIRSGSHQFWPATTNTVATFDMNSVGQDFLFSAGYNPALIRERASATAVALLNTSMTEDAAVTHKANFGSRLSRKPRFRNFFTRSGCFHIPRLEE